MQIVGEDVVGVYCSNEAVNRKAHLHGEEPGGEVAEVAAGHRENKRAPVGRQAGGGVEVVEGLGQEAGDVDGVGR